MAIIGLFDLLGAAKAVIVDPKWVGFSVEVYLLRGGRVFRLLLRGLPIQPTSRADAASGARLTA